MAQKGPIHAVKFLGLDYVTDNLGTMPDLLIPAKRIIDRGNHALHESRLAAFRVVRVRDTEHLDDSWRVVYSQQDFEYYVNMMVSVHKFVVTHIPNVFSPARQSVLSENITTTPPVLTCSLKNPADQNQFIMGMLYRNQLWVSTFSKVFISPSTSHDLLMVGRVHIVSKVDPNYTGVQPFQVKYSGGSKSPDDRYKRLCLAMMEGPEIMLAGLREDLNHYFAPMGIEVDLQTPPEYGCGLDAKQFVSWLKKPW